MAGNLKTNQVQLGDSATPTNNFVWLTNVDGTAKLARGNIGATTQDILTVDAAGRLDIPGNILVQSNQTPLPGVGASLSYAHGLGVVPASAELELVCLAAEYGYAVGDIVTPYCAPNASTYGSLTVTKNTTAVFCRTGNSTAFLINNNTNGSAASPTSGSWAWRFKVRAK